MRRPLGWDVLASIPVQVHEAHFVQVRVAPEQSASLCEQREGSFSTSISATGFFALMNQVGWNVE